VPDDAPLVVFDTRPARSQLMPAMFIALEHTVAKVERRRAARLTDDAVPPLFPGDALISDETWKLVQRRATGEFFNDLARRSRHLGLFMLAITQHLGDFDNEHGRRAVEAFYGDHADLERTLARRVHAPQPTIEDACQRRGRSCCGAPTSRSTRAGSRG
jgi:hypothetical protein